MADIRFYHLTRRTAEQALPELVDRAYGKGHKILIRCGSTPEVGRLNDHLWTFHPDAFLPHGTEAESFPEQQPVFLTSGNDNPGKADVLMLMPGADSSSIDEFQLCCVLLDGNDETQIASARTLWKTWKEAGHAITYWQQTDAGKWQQKT